LFYDKKRILTSGSKYRYYEIVKDFKYEEVIAGSFHDIKSHDILYYADFGCEDNFLGIATKSTDIIAIYQIENGEKYYLKTKKPITIYNTDKYKKIKKESKILLNTKYNKLKTDNNIDIIKVYFELYIDDSGQINEINYIGIFPEVESEEFNSELEKDILNITKQYPKVTPAKFFNEKVNFIGYDYIEF